MDLLLGGGGGAEVAIMGFLHREGGIGGDTSHNALKWVPSMYNSFDHFPYCFLSQLVHLLFHFLACSPLTSVFFRVRFCCCLP